MMFLKQSTAVVIPFGPFLDKTDGITLKADGTTITDIDHASTGIFLSKNGSDAAIRHASVTASVADDYGMMRVTLDTTDTNTCGTLRVSFAKAATYLPVWADFMVVNANVYDSLFAAATTDYLQVDVTQLLGTAWLTPGTAGTPDVNVKLISGDATAADNCELDYDGTGYAGGTIVKTADVTKIAGAAVNTALAQLGVNVVSQANIDFGATQKTSIGTAVNGQLTAANTELAAVPTTTGGLRAMIQFVFEKLRNKGTMNKDTGVETLFKEDAAATLGTATHSDDGTTVTRGEMN